MPILPTECPLDRPTKDVIYDTLIAGEIPCYGCPKSRECPESLEGNLEAAAVLMGEDMATLAEDIEGIIKCPRCGGVATVRWVTEPGKRIWACFREVEKWNQQRQCNWSRVKYADETMA